MSAGGLFPEWEAAHQFDPGTPKQLRAMWARYGQLPGRKCGDCAHLIAIGNASTYFKCRRYKITRGPGTDWRKKWTACKAFEQAEKVDDGPDKN